jgi:hypothetical protein
MVMAHREKEEQNGGREIWPALPILSKSMMTKKLSEEQQFCSQLEASSCLKRPELAW